MENEESKEIKGPSLVITHNIKKQENLPVPQTPDKKIEERKEEVIESLKVNFVSISKFIKRNYNWLIYIILALIVFLAVRIRTRNLPRLRDIVTGGWYLTPEYDPFLFLRWAKYIVEHGSLYTIDNMRYAPLGLETKSELLLLPYSMAWFHKLASLFGSTSVEQSAVLYPVFMFALTVIAFFFMTRKIFISSLGHKNASIIALISSFFFSITPVFLYRTIAGVPEKESAAFFPLFLGLYFFLSAWQAKSMKSQLSLALLAGISTAAMGLIWGGFALILFTITITIIVTFLLGHFDKQKAYICLIWLFSFLLLASSFFTARYPFIPTLKSFVPLTVLAILFSFLINSLITQTKLKKYFEHPFLSKIPSRITSLIITTILGILLLTIFFGPYFVIEQLAIIINPLLNPIADRLSSTIIENQQPYFLEWASAIGSVNKEIPIFFWLFFFGSIYLFYYFTPMLKTKERMILTLSYAIFLSVLVFSNFSKDSILNNKNAISFIVYALGAIIFLGTLAFYYYKYHKEGSSDSLKEIDVGIIMLMALFFLGLIATKSAIRLVLAIVPASSIIVAFFIVTIFNNARQNTNKKLILWILFIILLLATLFSSYRFYNTINNQAQQFAPDTYTQQWQKAMSWVRENTPANAVFAHWWDYGYWVQTIGERATITDGGNVISYWNYFMGRHVLTGTDNQDALEFLYAHNATHLLIDSTDILKYSSYSLIGSDKNLDRKGLPTIIHRANQLTKETKNSTTFFYVGKSLINEDIVYEENDTKIFLPGESAEIEMIIIEKDNLNSSINQPVGIFTYKERQYTLPIRYAYDKEFIDFGSGIEEGIFLLPRLNPQEQGGNYEKDGTLLYLSKRMVNSQVARLSLYNEENPYFKLVHLEQNDLVSQLRAQNLNTESDFLYYKQLRGPIKIWEINYPEDIEFKEEYLSTDYPEELQLIL